MPERSLPPIPPITRTEVDGVTTFWMDEPGPMVASLLFRVGRSDEPTPCGGISHIVEHLALSGLGIQDYDHNGFVDANLTVFTSVGRPDEIQAFLDNVTRGLRGLPLDRLLLERRILREERNQRGPSYAGAVRWYRYGYGGHGRGLGPEDDELGLDWLGPDPVRAWADRWFTRQNAVLWITGPVPAGLKLDLPDGPPPVTTAPVPLPQVPFPAHMRWKGPGASLGFTASRSSAINIAANIASRRARQRLRFDEGLVYDIAFEYEALAPMTAHIALMAECPDDRIGPVIDGLLRAVRGVASDGPTPTELDQEVDAFIRQYEDRDGRIGVLALTAMETLWGGPVVDPVALLAERSSIGAAETAEAMGSALESLLVLANCDELPGLAQYPPWSPGRVEGRVVSPAGFFLPGRRPKERLHIGADGVTVAVKGTEWMTVRFADCVASIHPSKTVRILLDRDGTSLIMDPQGWTGVWNLIETIDEAIPADRVACPEHGVGALADPA